MCIVKNEITVPLFPIDVMNEYRGICKQKEGFGSASQHMMVDTFAFHVSCYVGKGLNSEKCEECPSMAFTPFSV